MIRRIQAKCIAQRAFNPLILNTRRIPFVPNAIFTSNGDVRRITRLATSAVSARTLPAETKDVLILMYRVVSSERRWTKCFAAGGLPLAIRALVKVREHDNYMKES